ncbi:hypothetical protein SPHINGO391_410125 [Sphingomonas aurantiaca]|jgi:hypothetical protein|uniref:Uncharacterized protein n=1 Tax=Sphingomonas aurantiaca TaxID=185949 RepID=A0A5E7Z3M1_9SPHN|nr:hypothetical protein SPHINGO391_410125 [Sphingomonas aurantiaca]
MDGLNVRFGRNTIAVAAKGLWAPQLRHQALSKVAVLDDRHSADTGGDLGICGVIADRAGNLSQQIGRSLVLTSRERFNNFCGFFPNVGCCVVHLRMMPDRFGCVTSLHRGWCKSVLNRVTLGTRRFDNPCLHGRQGHHERATKHPP